MRRPAGLLVLLCLACASYTPTPYPQQRPDRRELGGTEIEAAPTPLTAAEVERAGAIAGAELRTRGLLDARTFFVHAEMLHDKAAPAARRALVLHYRYAGDTTFTSVVDLAQEGRVVDMRTDHNVPAPLSREEFAEAQRLAMADERVTGMLGPNRARLIVEPLVLRAASPSDPLFGHRAVSLLFRFGTDFICPNIVIVDLSASRVLIEPRRETLHPMGGSR